MPPQPAAERRSAERALRTLIAAHAPAHQRLIGALRHALRKRLPTANEIVYTYRDCFVISYSPDERGYAGPLALRCASTDIRLYFNRGKELPDPAHLLRGSGTQTRWTPLANASTLAAPAIARLIDEALARGSAPFAATGRGGVILRSSSRKPRKPTPPPARSAPPSLIRFSATLHRPAPDARDDAHTRTSSPPTWSFLKLPRAASAKLPSRGMVSVEGTINDIAFSATLSPDGAGGHWLKVPRTLRASCGASVGAKAALAFAPLPPDREPEPSLPADFRAALAAAASPHTRATWKDITVTARRDFIHWITSPKRPETRAKRIATACDKLARGARRPCCFDRSGMYDKSLSCPVADDGH